MKLSNIPPLSSNRKIIIKSLKASRVEQRMKQFKSDTMSTIIIDRILDTAFLITGREVMGISESARKRMFKGMPALQEANIRQLGLDEENYKEYVN